MIKSTAFGVRLTHSPQPGLVTWARVLGLLEQITTNLEPRDHRDVLSHSSGGWMAQIRGVSTGLRAEGVTLPHLFQFLVAAGSRTDLLSLPLSSYGRFLSHPF